jgi:hypothetical protein
VAPGGQAVAHALGSVVLERLLGTIVLVLAAVLGVVLFSPHASWGSTVPSLVVAVGVVAVGTGLVFAPPVPAWVLDRTGGWVRKGLSFLIEVHERVRGYARKPGVLSVSAAIGFGQQYLLTTINWIVARALGLPLAYTDALWMWPFVMLAVRLPISFLGFGVREAVLFGLFAGAGLSAASAVSLGGALPFRLAVRTPRPRE